MTGRALRHALRHALGRFLRDEAGSVTVEAVLIFPMLCWAYLGTFVFFDGFRDQSLNVKAAYTIGDTLSRQTEDVTPTFLNSMATLQGVLMPSSGARGLRVTAICYRATGDRFRVAWSQGRGTVGGVAPAALTDTTLALQRSSIPAMADGEMAILTESWAAYAPPMDVGIRPLTFRELVVTRPRFALNNRFCYNSGSGASVCTCPAG